eukprot:724506-Prorocentrum_minimum.AAC.1
MVLTTRPLSPCYAALPPKSSALPPHISSVSYLRGPAGSGRGTARPPPRERRGTPPRGCQVAGRGSSARAAR